jgi:hypothetical protein
MDCTCVYRHNCTLLYNLTLPTNSCGTHTMIGSVVLLYVYIVVQFLNTCSVNLFWILELNHSMVSMSFPRKRDVAKRLRQLLPKTKSVSHLLNVVNWTATDCCLPHPPPSQKVENKTLRVRLGKASYIWLCLWLRWLGWGYSLKYGYLFWWQMMIANYRSFRVVTKAFICQKRLQTVKSKSCNIFQSAKEAIIN